MLVTISYEIMQNKRRVTTFVGTSILIGSIFTGGYFLMQQSIKNNSNDAEIKLAIQKEALTEEANASTARWEIIKNSNGAIQPVVLSDDKLRHKKRWVEDVREYQHGVDFVQKKNGDYILVWASSGNALKPRGAREDGEWIHDIYYSDIDKNNPTIEPTKIIKAPLAQEPASAAMNNEGHLMITMEDAWRATDTLAQTFGVYNEDMESTKPYQQVAFSGGHSGHVSAVGDKFAIFYSNEWVDGGGVDNLGSGDDVLLNIYDTEGNFVNKSNVAVGNKTRDWWPLVAGSENKALLLWQRFVPGKKYADLMFSVYDVETGKYIKTQIRLKSGIKYYTYDAQYLSEIDRFLVLGSDSLGKGFGVLISTEGEVIIEEELPLAIVREAQPATKTLNAEEIKVIYPAGPSSLVALSIMKNKIIIKGVFSAGYAWEAAGTDGIFLDNNDVYFVSLSSGGLEEFKFKIYNKK